MIKHLKKTLLILYINIKYYYRCIRSRLLFHFESPSAVQLNNNTLLYCYPKTDWRANKILKEPEFSNDEIIKEYNSFTKQADVIIDAGSNYGQFLLSINPEMIKDNVQIHCFEPNPKLYRALKKSVLQSPLLKQVTMHNSILTAKTIGKTSFYIDLYSSGNSSIYNRKAYNLVPLKIHSKKIEAYTTSIDEVVSQKNDYILIKIDCEGEDFNVLNGAKHLITRARGYKIIVETILSDYLKFKEQSAEILDYLFSSSSKIQAFYNDKFHTIHNLAEYEEALQSTIGHVDIVFTK